MILFSHKTLGPWLSSGANVVTSRNFYPVLCIFSAYVLAEVFSVYLHN